MGQCTNNVLYASVSLLNVFIHDTKENNVFVVCQFLVHVLRSLYKGLCMEVSV